MDHLNPFQKGTARYEAFSDKLWRLIPDATHAAAAQQAVVIYNHMVELVSNGPYREHEFEMLSVKASDWLFDAVDCLTLSGE